MENFQSRKVCNMLNVFHISFNSDYFTQAGAAPGQTNADGTPYAGGVLNGIVGTLEMLLAAAIMAVPVGLAPPKP